jgi:zinc and cadmium transporter
MPTLAWIIASTALSGALSALLASLFLLVPEARRLKLLPGMVSFATGALLSVALLSLLPEAIETAGPANVERVGAVLLGGILLFFVLEKLVLWRHCHQTVCEGHTPQHHGHHDAASAPLILIGDGFHNVLDGMLIAAAFMTDIHLGIVTAIAVAAHEIPQEVGDLAILLHGGMSRRRALWLNLLTSLVSAAGGIVAYFALEDVQRLLPYAIALAASSFLYIAVADLIPGLHRRTSAGAGSGQFVFISLGVAVIYFTGTLVG